MTRISNDINNASKWKPCYRKREEFSVAYNTNGLVFVSPIDGTKTCACYDTPLVLTDSEGVVFAESIRELMISYTTLEKTRINSRTIDKLKNGEELKVIPRENGTYYSIHVSTEKYGFNCPFGLNKEGTVCADGDYLVCRKIGGYKYPINNYRYKRYYREA